MKSLFDKNRWGHLLGILNLFFSERRTMLLLGIFLASLTALAGIILLGVSGWFITATAIAGLTTATALAFDVFAPAAAIRFLAIVRTTSRYGERLVTHDATLDILAALRERLFRGWSRPEAARALLARPATLLFRLTVDTDALDSLYLRIIVPAGAAIITTLIAGVILLFAVHPALALALCLWLFLIGFGAPVIASGAASRTARRRAYGLEALRARTIDLVSGQTELAVAGRLPAQCKTIMEADRYLATADNAFNRIETATTAVFATASAIALTATLLTVAALVESGAISAPVAALALLIALSAMEPFAGLRRGALELGRTMLAARRLAPRLKPQPEAPAYPAPKQGFALTLSNVTAGYPGSDSPLFHDLSLEIRQGERVALVGPSGSGKSTLLAIITGELQPISGTIRSAKGTLLPQKTELFRDTIRENLLLAAPAATDEQLWKALKAAGLSRDIERLPKGLDSELGEGGMGLSGGQSRRLVLARLFLRDTPFWIFDESTESLDHETAQDVLKRLETMVQGKTLLLATHIRREAELADRLLVMNSGRIISDLTKGSDDFMKELINLKNS